MKVKEYIAEKLSSEGAMLFSLIDPLDYSDMEHIVATAKNAYEGGTDIVLIGGSIGVQGPFLDAVVKNIKEVVSVPVVLFPGNIATLTPYADATYFMSLLNSRNTYWITRAQMLAAPVVKKLDMETLSIAYLVGEPGGSVGFVGEVDLLPRENVKIAAAYAMAAELMGFDYVLTDAGSNPKEHLPLDFISAVRKATNLPYIVAGGIKTPDQAANVIRAGADCIQVGTAFELENGLDKFKAFVASVKGEGKKRI
ncbi:MAG: geranylgeranylglyceryl/heptaprenylglyceryl phosphate synthase [Methanobacteriota archaeon]|nr:MAG: geranylgeranylglyceryl/heptaprenylglyceryl phosphate synthase [Euryarchaeota archaeon]